MFQGHGDNNRYSRMTRARKLCEGHIRYTAVGVGIWNAGTAIAGIAAGAVFMALYIRNAAVYGLDVGGAIWGIHAGGYVMIAIWQAFSLAVREDWPTKSDALRKVYVRGKQRDEDGRRQYVRSDEDNLVFQTIWEFLFSYYASSAVLALGYYCTTLVVGGALTMELAAAAGAITGGIIAVPSILFGPNASLHGTMPHIWDIMMSAAAGTVALVAAHASTEAFFIHMGMSTIPQEIACLLHAAIALPVFASIKILLSTGYEVGLMWCVSRY